MRYLSLHSNQYQRYFFGHTDEVTSVDLSPRSDAFLTAAKVSRAPLLLPLLSPSLDACG